MKNVLLNFVFGWVGARLYPHPAIWQTREAMISNFNGELAPPNQLFSKQLVMPRRKDCQEEPKLTHNFLELLGGTGVLLVVQRWPRVMCRVSRVVCVLCSVFCVLCSVFGVLCSLFCVYLGVSVFVCVVCCVFCVLWSVCVGVLHKKAFDSRALLVVPLGREFGAEYRRRMLVWTLSRSLEETGRVRKLDQKFGNANGMNRLSPTTTE